MKRRPKRSFGPRRPVPTNTRAGPRVDARITAACPSSWARTSSGTHSWATSTRTWTEGTAVSSAPRRTHEAPLGRARRSVELVQPCAAGEHRRLLRGVDLAQRGKLVRGVRLEAEP